MFRRWDKWQIRTIETADLASIMELILIFRRDSDVYSPKSTAEKVFRRMRKLGSYHPHKDIDELIAKKKHLAVWIVSNCKSTRGAILRMNLVEKLEKNGLDLHKKGKCFPENGEVKSKDIIRNYKFYISFENSFDCKDYVTEKVFDNGYLFGTIPIIWGASKEDCNAILPPHSFIHVSDFANEKELVKYLNYLDRNTTAYREYFNWRTLTVKDMPQYGRQTQFCQLCRILHGINIDNIYNPKYHILQNHIPMFGRSTHSRLVPSLRKWFYDTESKECLAEGVGIEPEVPLGFFRYNST